MKQEVVILGLDPGIQNLPKTPDFRLGIAEMMNRNKRGLYTDSIAGIASKEERTLARA